MAKVHHDITVGMTAANAKVSGNATQAELTAQFVEIYNGDPASRYQACNAVWAFTQDGDFWGATGANEQEINANGWTIYLKAVRDANAQVGGGNLKGNISRNLAGLLSGGDPAAVGCNGTQSPPWTEAQLEDYADTLCGNIVSEGLEDCVGAWYLDDEGLKHLWYPDFGNVDAVVRAAEIVHGVQKSHNLNIPFQIAEELTIEGGREIAVCVDGDLEMEALAVDRVFWFRNDNDQPWAFQMPATLKARIDAFFDPQSVLSDARVTFLPFFYPWAVASMFWRYHRSVEQNGALSTVLRENPPWMVWKTAMDAFMQEFPAATYDRLEFQPVTDVSRQAPLGTGMYPRHVDLHKATRVLLDLRKGWEAIFDDRFTGIWYTGWMKTGHPEGEGAHKNWTQTGTYRYAEAIQNEIGAGAEGLPEVWTDDQGAAITTEIVAVVEGVSTAPPPTVPAGVTARAWRIQYRLGPPTLLGPTLVLGTGRKLGERRAWKMEIWRAGLPPRLVRTITEGFLGTSPNGRYEGDVTTEGDPDFGTSAYWDGLWDDSGGFPGKDGTLASAGSYTVHLIVDGVTEDSAAFTWA